MEMQIDGRSSGVPEVIGIEAYMIDPQPGYSRRNVTEDDIGTHRT